LRLHGLGKPEIEAKVKDAARLLEIDGLLQRRPQELSGGQRQRVALGRAIVRQPKIFLFDEPLSNLDATLRASMRVELARLHRRLSATIVYVTHDQAEALTLGEKIIVLDKGTIQQIGSASEIYRKPANMLVAGFVGSPQMNFLDGKMDESGVSFRRENLDLNLSTVLEKSLREFAGQPVTLGIRPEDLQPCALERAWMRGEVDLVEDLGSDRFVHVKSEGADLIARAAGDATFHTGEAIGLAVAPGQLHVFQDGKRIEV
jgi:ABC-type sugar transport system ATPase subunit